MKTILFQWTGAAPRDARVDHKWQVSCAAVFPTAAAFRRATHMSLSYYKNYVGSDVDPRPDIANEGAQLAMANPGTVYWQDTLRHIPRDAPWLVHPTPETSA